MTLTENELKAIDEKALYLYPITMQSVTLNGERIEYDYCEEIRDAYINGVTKERIKAKKFQQELDGMYSLNKEGWGKVKYYEKQAAKEKEKAKKLLEGLAEIRTWGHNDGVVARKVDKLIVEYNKTQP